MSSRRSCWPTWRKVYSQQRVMPRYSRVVPCRVYRCIARNKPSSCKSKRFFSRSGAALACYAYRENCAASLKPRASAGIKITSQRKYAKARGSTYQHGEGEVCASIIMKSCEAKAAACEEISAPASRKKSVRIGEGAWQINNRRQARFIGGIYRLAVAASRRLASAAAASKSFSLRAGVICHRRPSRNIRCTRQAIAAGGMRKRESYHGVKTRRRKSRSASGCSYSALQSRRRPAP